METLPGVSEESHMRSRLAIVLVFVLAVALIACGDADGDEASATAAAPSPAATESTPTAAPTPTAASTPAATATPTTATGAATAPDDVFREFVEAINAGDRDAAEALLAADATWERGGQCPPGQCMGLERLGQEIERDIANHHEMKIVSAEVSGDTVTARVELRTDMTRAAGVERIIHIFTATVEDGKIVALRVEIDRSDPETAQFTRQGRQGPQ